MNTLLILVVAGVGLAIAAYFVFFMRRSISSPPIAVGANPAVNLHPTPTKPAIEDTPDTPQSFGYKMAWFAIPTKDSEKVISAFGLTDGKRAFDPKSHKL